jgi:hypothetical protein
VNCGLLIGDEEASAGAADDRFQMTCERWQGTAGGAEGRSWARFGGGILKDKWSEIERKSGGETAILTKTPIGGGWNSNNRNDLMEYELFFFRDSGRIRF